MLAKTKLENYWHYAYAIFKNDWTKNTKSAQAYIVCLASFLDVCFAGKSEQSEFPANVW